MGRRVRVRPTTWMGKGDAMVPDFDRGRPLMVFGGIPGEEATVDVVHDGRNQSLGLWERSVEPHAHRVSPPCDRYRPCGGCPHMHLNPEGQEGARRALVADCLSEYGLDDVVLGEFHASPDGPRDFRHVIKVAVGVSDRGLLRLGAWGRGSRRVVPIPNCPVAAPVLRETMAALAYHVIDLDLRPYDPRTDRGVIRSIVLRASRATQEVLITLIVGRRVRELSELADRVAGQVANVAGVWMHINTGAGNAIFSRDGEGVIGVRALLGKEVIEDTIAGVRYRVGPGDFFQTNPGTADLLYRRAMERAGIDKTSNVIDLYCGVGGLALAAAARGAAWVLGAEELEGAVTRARDNARINQLEAAFVTGRVEDSLPDLARRAKGLHPTVMVNPARRGLEPGVLAGIVALKPERVMYVSCSPRAMARDLAGLRAAGLVIGDIEMFDMFPHTPHVECLVTLDNPEVKGQPRRRSPRRTVVRRKR